MGNKDEASGDGFMHIGASSLQVTGKDNYIDFSNWVGAKKKLTTDEIAENYFWEGGLYYFQKNKLPFFNNCTNFKWKNILFKRKILRFCAYCHLYLRIKIT